MGLNLYVRRRTAVDCGCGAAPTPLSGWLLLRNALLLGLVPCAALPAAVDAMAGALAAVVAVFLWLAYGAGNQLLANQGNAALAEMAGVGLRRRLGATPADSIVRFPRHQETAGETGQPMPDWLVASNLVLWLAVALLGALVYALARQVGALSRRIAPAGALMVNEVLQVGDAAPEVTLRNLQGGELTLGGTPQSGAWPRSTLIFFLGPDCPVCQSLLPVLRSVAKNRSLVGHSVRQ